MSRLWQTQLQAALARPASPQRPPRVAVLGIGHELCGDDGAGPAVARGLRPYAGDDLLVIDAGAAPENWLGPVRRFAPDLVLLVDAADLDAPPGAIRWLDWQEAAGLNGSTHTLSLSMLAGYLTAEIGCAVALIGIQPADVRLGAAFSAPVQAAVAGVVQALAVAVSPAGGSPAAVSAPPDGGLPQDRERP